VSWHTRFENICSTAVTSPKAACDCHRWGHFKGRDYMCFGGCKHWYPDSYYGNNETLGSRFVKICCKYQKYVHMKACLARRYIPIAWGQVRMTLIPAPGKAKCTEVKGNHPLNLLFFMQEMMQKLVARYITDKSLGLCPRASIPICLQTREVHRNGNASRDYTYTGSSCYR